jgi:hypothetical protein
VTPTLDPANQNRRAIDRLRAQKDAAEQVVLNSPDVIAAVAPLVRHVNTVTTHLNEAQVTIGRLTAERDALRQRLIDETGALAEQIDRQMAVEVVDGERRQNRLVRQEGREQARVEGDATEDEPGKVSLFFQRLGLIIPDDATEEEFKQSARRRQIFAVVILALLGLGMWLFQQGSGSGTFSRETLALIPYVGTIVQVFLAAWVLYRIVRVGGKGPAGSSRSKTRVDAGGSRDRVWTLEGQGIHPVALAFRRRLVHFHATSGLGSNTPWWWSHSAVAGSSRVFNAEPRYESQAETGSGSAPKPPLALPHPAPNTWPPLPRPPGIAARRQTGGGR